jgi:o-succinylbenzoate synthase
VIIRRLTYTSYELPFKKSLHTARGVISVRRGFIVAVHTDDGIGIGEAAPLPEFGTETMEEAGEELEKQKAESEKQNFEIADDRPATRFGVEAALNTLISGFTPLYPPAKAVGKIAVNALISGETAEEILHAAGEVVRAGYRTLKIKVGARTVREDIEIMRMLRAEFGEVALRADANGAWSLDEARQFAHGAAACDLEYIEDPLRNPDIATLTVFRRNCEAAIACDDMARDIARKEKIIERRLCDVMIFKPSVLGSYESLETLAHKAKTNGMAVVITSLLESSVGLSYIAHCAAAFGSPELAHGFGTAELFERDTLSPPLMAEYGEIALPDLTALSRHLIPDIATQLSVPN